jgi:hypothetical protein
MKTTTNTIISSKYLPPAAGIFAIVVGGVVLLGWLFKLPTLQSILPGLPKMVANTALAFVLSGLSLWLASTSALGHNRHHRLAQILAGLVLLISLLTLSQYLFGWNLGIDELLFTDPVGPEATSSPGRSSPRTTLAFSLVGLALLLLPGANPRRHWLAQFLTLTAIFIALLALVGYSFNLAFFYSISAYTGMALHTALTFLVLGVGLLFLQPTQGLMAVLTGHTLGGAMARRLLLAAIVVPLAVGWVSISGRRAGLYTVEFEPVLLCGPPLLAGCPLPFWPPGASLGCWR